MKTGWQTKQLGELCRFIDYRGKTPEKTASGLRLITAKNVKMGYLQENPIEFVAPESYDIWMTRGIPKMGDVLFTTEAPLANVAQLDTEEKVVFAQRIIVLQPAANNLDRTFLKYLLLSDVTQNRILAQGTGATVQGIKASLLKTIPIEFPPLTEQQRIVGLLDDAFEGLAIAKANAEKNLQNARALFESRLQSVFTQRDPRWVEKPLETVASILNGFAFKSTDFSAEEGAKCIKITNVGVREFVSNSDGYLPDSFAAEYEKVSVKEGSIVIALTRTIIAGGLKVAVVPEEYDGALLNQRVASIITNERDLQGDFLFAYLSTQAVVDYVKKRVNTLMQPNLSITDLRLMPIPTPTRCEQNKITEQLDSLREETLRLARLYERKLAALEALKKSLLHQAFTGQL